MKYIEKSTEFSCDFEVNPKLEENVKPKTILNQTISLIKEEIQETIEAIDSNNTEEILDGFGDIAFIAFNGIYKVFRCYEKDNHDNAREKTTEVMMRISNANLAKKQPDGTIQYINGKVQKPSNWQEPQYKDLLNNKN